MIYDNKQIQNLIKLINLGGNVGEYIPLVAENIINLYRNTEPDDKDIEFLVSSIDNQDLILHIAIHVKEKGNLSVCRKIIWQNIKIDRNNPWLHYELALTYANSNYLIFRECLMQAIKKKPDFKEAVRILLYAAFIVNDKKTLAIVGNYTESALVKEIFLQNEELFEYLRIIDKNDSLNDYSGGIFYNNVIDIKPHEIVADKIRKSKANIIRLGDGEGSMFIFDEFEEGMLANQYKKARNHFSQRWMRIDYDNAPEVFATASARVAETLMGFDIIAVPGNEWLLYNLRTNDTLGFISTYNVRRKVMEIMHDKQDEIIFCETNVMQDLLYRDAITYILGGYDNFVLVSWNDTGIENIIQKDKPCKLVKIPCSASDSKNMENGEEYMTTDFAKNICKYLSDSIEPNSTVLLCCGFFGKSVSAELMSKGCKIIDIGSAMHIKANLPIREIF